MRLFSLQKESFARWLMCFADLNQVSVLEDCKHLEWYLLQYTVIMKSQQMSSIPFVYDCMIICCCARCFCSNMYDSIM